GCFSIQLLKGVRVLRRCRSVGWGVYGSVSAYLRPLLVTHRHLRRLRLGNRDRLAWERSRRNRDVPPPRGRDERNRLLRLGPHRAVVVSSEARDGSRGPKAVLDRP